MTPLEIKDEFYKNWIAPDCLVKLDANDTHAPFEGQTLDTVNNDNGILYLAYAMAMFHKLGIADYKDSVTSMRALNNIAVPGLAGLYHRRPGLDFVLDSHDNMVGQVALSVIFGFDGKVAEILEYGKDFLWMFNNTNPTKWEWKAVRQPGDWAFCRIAAGRKPGLLPWIWFLVGATLSIRSKRNFSKNLLWLRLYTMNLKRKSMGWFTRKTFDLLTNYFFKTIKPADANFKTGYRSDHPISLLSSLAIDFRNK